MAAPYIGIRCIVRATDHPWSIEPDHPWLTAVVTALANDGYPTELFPKGLSPVLDILGIPQTHDQEQRDRYL